MTIDPLDELAQRCGIAIGADASGSIISAETKRRILAALGFDVSSEEAVQRHLAETAGATRPALRAAAGRCHIPDWLEAGRAWGISLQLYELRSRRNWGIGDFADLADFSNIAGGCGADFVGINPVHALFIADPWRCSPFSPSNRLFLNPLYIAVDQVWGAETLDIGGAALAHLRETPLVDYEAVAALKLDALRRLWLLWASMTGPSAAALHDDHDRFKAQHGEALRRHAVFETLSSVMVAAGFGSGWASWPPKYRSADSPQVDDFAAEHSDDVEFHIWLQWLADAQLGKAAEAARSSGMRIGLYLDVAVGDAPDGSATWSRPDQYVSGMTIGAPPDVFSAAGQNWGLAPLSPISLMRDDFAAYRSMMETAMRHAGAVRLDHVMALWQLFYVPQGSAPADGAYVRYPMEDLTAILAALSLKHRTILIGEDLGNVPPGFRAVMNAAGILSYRILYFEERDGRFISPAEYPRLALACASTHDLPTLRGWLAGGDIVLRQDHGLVPQEASQEQARERAIKRNALLEAVASSGAMPRETARHDATGFEEAVHRFLAMTSSMLAGARLADLTGEMQPTNLPGTIHDYPNWRLKSSIALEDLPEAPLFCASVRALAEERPRIP